MANSFISILTSLDVDNQSSRDNINDYIKKLKDLPSVKISLEVDGMSQLNDTSKVIKDLQRDVSQLKKEMGSLGSNSLSGSFKSFNDELSKSFSSLDDLEKKVKSLGGSLKVVTGKGILPSGIESDSMIKSVEAQFRDVDNLLKKVQFKPELDFFGGIQGLNQIKESISNVDFKDFDKKASKTEETLKRLGRQGNLSAEELKDLQSRLNALSDIRSVSELEKLNAEIKEMGVNASQATKFANALTNINNQISPIIPKLRELNNIDGIDKMGLNSVINDLQRLQNVDIKTDQQLKEVNLQFKNAERGVKSFVKEAERIQKVNEQIAKLEDKIRNLGTKGLLDKDTVDGFLIDTSLVDKSASAVRKLEQQIVQFANRTEEANKVKNAIENIVPAVDRLNDKLNITVAKLGNGLDTAKLSQLRDEIFRLANTEINTADDIARVNSQLSQTERAITQLAVAGQATNQFENMFRRAEQALEKLELTGYASAESINRLRTALNSVNTGDLDTVRRVVSQIDDELTAVGNNRSAQNTIQALGRDLQTLETNLQRIQIQHRNAFNAEEAQRLQQEINNIRTALNNLPDNNIPTAEFDRLRNSVARARNELQQFNNGAIETSRTLRGMIANADQAALKFLLWTGISSVVYGVANGIQDLTEKVIELDTALVGISRVANADQFELDGLLEKAIDNVDTLSGKTTEYLEILNEFSRQGNTLNESLALADTTQILTNISDLDGTGATDALIASMVNFNVTAEESIRIADKLNEVN